MVLRIHGMDEAGVRFSIGPPNWNALRHSVLDIRKYIQYRATNLS